MGAGSYASHGRRLTVCGNLNKEPPIHHRSRAFHGMRNEGGRAFAAKVFIWAVVAASVIGSSSAAGQQVSRWDVFGGYSYMRFESTPLGFAGNSNLTGWNAAVAYNFTDAFSVAIDGSGLYGNQITTYNYMVGPQYSYRWERSRAFAQFFFGKAQNTVNVGQPVLNGVESVGRTLGGGGGYDWDLNSRFTLRAVQVDYLRTTTFGLTQGNIRVSAGVVVHFGRSRKKRRL